MKEQSNPFQAPANTNAEIGEVEEQRDWLLFCARLIFVYTPIIVVLMIVVYGIAMFCIEFCLLFVRFGN